MKPREQRHLACCLVAALVIGAVLYLVLTWWFNPPGELQLPPPR